MCKKSIKMKIIEALKEIDAVNISMDLWSDATMRGFVGIIAHGINRNWQMVELYVQFKMVSGRHTGDLVKDIFDNTCIEFG